MLLLPSYRNQSIDLLCKSIDWSVYEGNIGIWWVNLSFCTKKISGSLFFLNYLIFVVILTDYNVNLVDRIKFKNTQKGLTIFSVSRDDKELRNESPHLTSWGVRYTKMKWKLIKNNFELKLAEAYSECSQTSKMEFFYENRSCLSDVSCFRKMKFVGSISLHP